MGMQVNNDDLKRMFGNVIEIMREKKLDLCRLDAAIGDGDHGITMLRAMEKMGEVIAAEPGGDIGLLLGNIAWALMDIDGGAVGPLYGSLFLGMSEATVGVSVLDENNFTRMFESGLKGIQTQTKAREGDKTLMDALIPAVQALRSSADKGMSLPEMLDAAATAAMEGAENTRNFPAHFGRAKYQGERTLGHPDPGSVSMACFFRGLQIGLVIG